MKVLVTGASGFVGHALVARLGQDAAFEVDAAIRRPPGQRLDNVTYTEVANATPDTDWHETLTGVEVVIHSIARVHVMDDGAVDPSAEYRRVNVGVTLNLAQQAAQAGARRFVFLSSIKVNGDKTEPGKPFRADDRPAPACPYGKSKLEAEIALLALAEETHMEVVIVRPPLVYGPGVKANFQAMMCWVCKGWPLPFGSIHNKRSLVALDNLVDLVRLCCIHPNAANRVFLVSDDDDVSTTELIRRIGIALQKPTRLLSIPTALIRMLGVIGRRTGQVDRLLGSLQVDVAETRSALNWTPLTTMENALHRTARHFLDSRKS